MRHPLYTPSTMPVIAVPSTLLTFIQQAQLSLVYVSGGDDQRTCILPMSSSSAAGETGSPRKPSITSRVVRSSPNL
jgi:hypothetical protein